MIRNKFLCETCTMYIVFLELILCLHSFCFLKMEAYNRNPIQPLLLVPE